MTDGPLQETAEVDAEPEIVEEVGAPDKLLYLKKPFDPDELQARLSVGERMVRLEREKHY